MRNARVSRLLAFAIVTLSLPAASARAASGDITTVAGGGTPQRGYGVIRLAIDEHDNVFFTEAEPNRVRRVDPEGNVTTIAGGSTRGFCGDGGPAVNACLDLVGPFSGSSLRMGGLDPDGAGNLYVADTYNNRIRRIDATGTITTVAGSGAAGFCGDGGPAIEACLNAPSDVATDRNGNIFIGDYRRVRKVDSQGIITTVTGATTVAGAGVPGQWCGSITTGTHNCWHANGVAVDAMGNIFIADSANNVVRRLDTSGNISTFAGTGVDEFCGDGGPAMLACLDRPQDVGFDASGNVYIADYSNGRVRKVDAAGIITTVAGEGFGGGYANGDGGPAAHATMLPLAVGVDSSQNLLIAGNGRIRRVDASGTITSFFGDCPDGGKPTAVCLEGPRDVTMDSSGVLYISDLRRIAKIDASGAMSTVVRDVHPFEIAMGRSGELYAAEPQNNRILRIDPRTRAVEVFAGGVAPSEVGPVCFLDDSICLPGEPVSARVSRVKEMPARAAQLASPRGVAVDPAGNVYIADTGNDRVLKVDGTGIATTIAGDGTGRFCGDGGPALGACLDAPTGLAFDPAGNLLIVDASNFRIRSVDPGGIITTLAVLDDHPRGITVDAGGAVYFSTLARVYKVGLEITPIAGNGRIDSCGDGVPALNTCVYAPTGLTVDPAGNLFIAATGNLRIRKVAA